MTGTGPPSEDLLDSAGPDTHPRSRPRAGLVVSIAAVLLVVAGLFGFQALQPEPAAEPAQPTQISETATADPSLVDASARRLYGELPPLGAQSFSAAVSAATQVVRIHCRPEVPSWAATLISSGDSYDRATFLMSPANRRYGTFVVQVELTWMVDHFAYAVVAGHVERCV